MWAMRVPLWDLSWRHVMTHVNSKTNARLGGGGGGDGSKGLHFSGFGEEGR